MPPFTPERQGSYPDRPMLAFAEADEELPGAEGAEELAGPDAGEGEGGGAFEEIPRSAATNETGSGATATCSVPEAGLTGLTL